ncbi:hypothetical protein JW998_13820 [candidate division KSB1 bacterium]|nr:hypothetical protein [candidate division KSB1 bacterium]
MGMALNVMDNDSGRGHVLRWASDTLRYREVFLGIAAATEKIVCYSAFLA